jgi:aspartyl-tRNA synthetase
MAGYASSTFLTIMALRSSLQAKPEHFLSAAVKARIHIEKETGQFEKERLIFACINEFPIYAKDQESRNIEF